MKPCPHCAEQIQDAAKVCPHCQRRVVPVKLTWLWLVLGLVIIVAFLLEVADRYPTAAVEREAAGPPRAVYYEVGGGEAALEVTYLNGDGVTKWIGCKRQIVIKSM